MRWNGSRTLALLAAVLLAMTGCASGPSVTDVSCQAFEPICVSRRDTPETIDQVLEHNATWEALCGPMPDC